MNFILWFSDLMLFFHPFLYNIGGCLTRKPSQCPWLYFENALLFVYVCVYLCKN